MRAVVFVITLALWALQASPDLGANTGSVTDLECRDLGSNLNDLTNDFVTNGNWCRRITPASSNGVYIGAADTTAFDLDVHIVVAELLWLEL